MRVLSLHRRRLHLRRFLLFFLSALLMIGGVALAATPSTSGNDPVLFGQQTIEPGLDSNSAGWAKAFPFSNNTAGTATSIVVYLDSRNRATTLIAGLYSDNGGHPGTRLAVGSVSRPGRAVWVTVPVPSTAVSSGKTYWVAILGEGGRLRFRDQPAGPCASERSSQTSLSGLPLTWTPGSRSTNCPVSAYVAGTVSAPPPGPPANTALPQISGSATQGQVLTTSAGSWSGSPTSYSYAWQDCNGSGANCTTISGAGASAYTLTSGDVNHTIRAIVKATNAAGSASATSAPTAVVASTPAGQVCSTTVNAGANLATAIANAPNGGTVCLNGGTYPFEQVKSVHTSYVTVEPVSGQSATIAGMQTEGAAFLRLQGLTFTSGIDMRSASDHDIQVIDNKISNTCFGVAISGNTGPVTNVLIQGNYIHNLSNANCGGSGYAAGQGVTINWGANVTISHNTFLDIGEHYIQGCGNPTSVDHNLFEGPGTPDSGAHLNIWQIWSGGSNCSFTNNIIGPSAADPIGLIFENGPGGNGSARMSNITVSNNLFNHAATQEPWQIGAVSGLTLTNNTVVGTHYGSVIQSEGGLTGSNYNVSHNIVVGTTDGADFNYGGCASGCMFDYNVSDDGSAHQAGSSHYVVDWILSWLDTVWYQPLNLLFAAGSSGSGTIGP